MKDRKRILSVMVLLAGVAGSLPAAPPALAAEREVRVPKFVYKPFFKEEGELDKEIGPLRVDRFSVTNAEFAGFVSQHPEWRRSRVKSLFADGSYLAHWTDAETYPAGTGDHPVTHVSWFAAREYCESQGKRLLTVAEWEAVSEAQAPETLEMILEWYSRPTTASSGSLRSVKTTKPNRLGLHGMHGLVWEWVEDFSSVIISGDSRGSNDTKASMFCGSGSLRAKDPAQYATFMRFAHRSSLSAKYTSSTLGFRCAR